MSEVSTLMTIDADNPPDLSQFNPELTHVLGGNTFTVEAAAKLHGNNGLQVWFNGTNYNCQRWVTPFSEQAGMYLRYYFKFSVGFTNSEEAQKTLNTCELRHDTGNTVLNQRWLISVGSTSIITMGQINYYDDLGNHFVASGSHTFTKNKWYRFENHYKKATAPGANNGEVEVRLYDAETVGEPLITSKLITGLDNDAVSLLNFAIGNLQGNCIPTNGSYFYIDDIVCNNEAGGWPGPYTSGKAGNLFNGGLMKGRLIN